MALPDDLLDELLSAYLDGATSRDECARVEQLLHDDAAVAERFEIMQQNRQAVQKSRLTGPKLPRDFAATVIAAAIERGESESLPESHPLRRAGAQSTKQATIRPVATEATSASQSHPGRWIALVAGLAASVLFIGILAKQLTDGDPTEPPPLIAQSADGNAEAPPTDPIIDGNAADSGPQLADSGSPDAGVASEERSGNASIAAEPMVADASTPAADAATGDTETPDPSAMVARSENTAMDLERRDPNTVNALAANAPTELSLLTVIKVALTDDGRSIDAFDGAMSKVEIAYGEEREVSDTLALVALGRPDTSQMSDTVDAMPTRVLLLESPAKKLDLLVNELISDRENVASVGFGLITATADAPLLRSINAVRVENPTEVQHQGIGSPLVGQSDSVFSSWSGRISNRSFAPLDQSMPISATVPGNGPNPMANILFLVR